MSRTFVAHGMDSHPGVQTNGSGTNCPGENGPRHLFGQNDSIKLHVGSFFKFIVSCCSDVYNFSIFSIFCLLCFFSSDSVTSVVSIYDIIMIKRGISANHAFCANSGHYTICPL